MPAAKTKVAVTDRLLKSMKPAPPGTRVTVWDGIQPNLGVRVTDRGKRSFVVVRRRAGEARPTWLSLGAYPQLSLAEARRMAREALLSLAEGKDPREAKAAERRAEEEAEQRRSAGTFAAAAEDYMKRHVAKLRTRAEVEAIIRRELVPAFGDRQLADVTKADVIGYLERVVDRGGDDAGPGHRRPGGGPHAARKRLALLRGFLGWCVERDLVPAAPTDRIKSARLLGSAEPRDRVLSDDELRAVWRAAEDTPYPHGPIVRMLALTGQRRDEIAAAKWSEVDLDKALLTVPARRMKKEAGHSVPLSKTAVEILRGLPRFASGDYVFAGRDPARPFGGFSAAKLRLDKKIAEMGAVVAPYTLHDIRRSVRTRLSELGVLPFVAELVLAHTQQGVAKVYDLHRYDAEKREALMKWEARLLSIVGSGPAVVPMRRR
jgi:integrase